MSSLTFSQRKALRRLGRGQTINRTMYTDPIISRCISRDHYIEPPDIFNTPYPQCMIDWFDWEKKAYRQNRPRLNTYGRELLSRLGATP